MIGKNQLTDYWSLGDQLDNGLMELVEDHMVAADDYYEAAYGRRCPVEGATTLMGIPVLVWDEYFTKLRSK